METAGEGTALASGQRQNGSREALLALALALVAAAPYAAAYVSFRVWGEDTPELVVDGVLFGGFLSPVMGISGCAVGVAAFRKATRVRGRVIATVPIIVAASTVAVFAYVVIAIAVMNSEG